MRISLLLQREPFFDILQETLAGYWSRRMGQPISVTRGQRPRGVAGDAPQRWWCNHWVNTIFSCGTPAADWEPIRREFTRSSSAWRRPWQQAYVELATRSPYARFLAHGQLWVCPGLPPEEQRLIVPGNHKIRILDRARGACHVLRKAGFPKDRFDAEIETRRRVQSMGIPVPAVIESRLDEGWYTEPFLCGTPLNRLADGRLFRRSESAALSALRSLVTQSRTMVPLETFLARQVDEIQRLCGRSQLLRERERQSLRSGVQFLQDQLYSSVSSSSELPVAMTHGDFQAANILVDSDPIWLIDWEHAGLRHATYDGLGYLLRNRSPRGLAKRLHEFVVSGIPPHARATWQEWPEIVGEDVRQRQHLAAWQLLAELSWHLAENDNRVFVHATPGLQQIQRELVSWQQQSLPR